MSIRQASVLTLLLVGCTVDDLQYEDRYCDPTYACAEGLICVQNRCTKGSTDGPLKLDGPTVDGKRDAPDDTSPDTTSPWDTFAPDTPADQMVVPDGGCPPGYVNCGGNCIDTLTSFYHCGGCNKPCPKGATDRCVSGQCHCGQTGPLCDNGLNCYQGSCTCLVGLGSLCTGCCKSGTCEPGTSTSACGVGSVNCSTCLTAICRQATCSGGICGQTNLPDGTDCVQTIPGVCHLGSCCTGCWNGSSCLSGTASSACGQYGATCKKCIFIQKCVGGNCI